MFIRPTEEIFLKSDGSTTLTAGGSAPFATGEPAQQTEIPLLTNDTTSSGAEVRPITNNGLDGLKLDVAQSAALSKSTGKDWLFYTTE